MQKVKRSLSFLLSLAILVSAVAVPNIFGVWGTEATLDVWDGSSDGTGIAGEGTADDPCIITTPRAALLCSI